MSTSAVSSIGMDVSSAAAFGTGIGMDVGTCTDLTGYAEPILEAGPSPMTPAHRPPPTPPPITKHHHAEVENWDDDFADDSPDSNSVHSDEEDLPVAGPSTMTFSPRSVRSTRPALEVVGGLDGEEDLDEDESWDEDEEDEGDEEEEEEDESWDEDEEDEVEVVVDDGGAVGGGRVPTPPSVHAAHEADTGPPTSSALSPDAWNATSSLEQPTLGPAPLSSTSPTTSPAAPSSASASTEPTQLVLPPSTQASVSSSTSSALSSFQASPSVPPPATSSSSPSPSPSSQTSTQTSLLPAHISTSVSAHICTSTPKPTNYHDAYDLEFGIKPHPSKEPHPSDDADHEFEDEDATITARSRHSRAKTRLSSPNTPAPVPPVPPVPSVAAVVPAACFAPPATLSSTTTATRPTAKGVRDEGEDRGEGPSRRVPVFSPPKAHISTPSSANAAASSPSKTPRRTIRPRTADSSLSAPRPAFQPVDASSRARSSLDAVRTFGSVVEAGHQGADVKDVVGGPTRVRRDALAGTAGVAEGKMRAGGGGMWSRLGQGVSRWAGSSSSSNTPSGPSTSTSTSSSTANTNTTNGNGIGIRNDGRRGRGRSNTVTGASMLCAPPPPTAPTMATATTAAPATPNGPTVIVEAAPRASFASGRPSTSSSSSSSNPGKATLRPRPATNATASSGAAGSGQTSQRNSIASLLSIRTYRSRTSSVSASASTSKTLSGSSSSSHPQDPSRAGRQSIDESEEAPPRSSMSSWTQRLFNGSGSGGSGGAGEARVRQSGEGTRPTFGVSVGVGRVGGGVGGGAGRRSMDVIGRHLAAGLITEAGRGEEVKGAGGGGGKEGETQTQTRGVLGFFGRRKRSNTVSALSPPSPASNVSGPDDKETQTEVYANKKASKSQRSLQVLLGRRPSAPGRRESVQSKRGGRVVAKVDGKEGQEGRTDVRAVEVDSMGPTAPETHTAPTTEPPSRGTKRSIAGARTSLPLAPPVRSGSEPTVGTQPVDGAVRPSPSKHLHTRSQSTSRSTSHSTSHSTSNSLSSIGELKIPSRISQAQVSIRRDLGLVKEFAGKVAELKDLQGSYLKMIESVQGMIDSDNGQPVALVKSSRPRSNTSPALSRPPPKSPLASLFQGPDSSSNANSSNATPSPVTQATPSTPATSATPSTPSPLETPLYNGADLVQRMADITARYDSWWECAELLIELGNTPPSVPTPVSTVRLTPPTAIFVAPPTPTFGASQTTPASPGPPPPTPTATITPKSRGDAYGALSSAASMDPMISPTSTSNHVGPPPKPTRGRANTFAGNMPVARLRSASTSTASITHGGHVQSLSTSSSSSSTAPSHTWRATTGRHDLSQRQLVLLREMLGVDQKPQSQVPRRPSAMSVQTRMDDEDEQELDADSDGEDATWRWGHANTVQLPSPAEEKEAYFCIPTRKPGRRPWNRAYHQSTAPSDDEDQGQEVYVVEPAETKKSKGMNAIRDMLRTLKRANPPTPTTPSFPMSAEAPPVMAAASANPPQSPHAATYGNISLSPAQHTVRRAASLLPLSSRPSARVPSSSSTMSRASKIDPALAFSMTPENIKPLLDNAREVTERLGECVADVRALLASAGVETVAVGDS